MESSNSNGQYYYAPHRRKWGVWLHIGGNEEGGFGKFIEDFPTKEEARREVYRRNGWRLKT